MARVKITVLKRMVNPDLVAEYRKPEYQMGPCVHFTEGQEFIVEHNMDHPKDFCSWAWNDLYKYFLALDKGGGFGPGNKDEHVAIACCTDGYKPVVFKLERIDED